MTVSKPSGAPDRVFDAMKWLGLILGVAFGTTLVGVLVVTGIVLLIVGTGP